MRVTVIMTAPPHWQPLPGIIAWEGNLDLTHLGQLSPVSVCVFMPDMTGDFTFKIKPTWTQVESADIAVFVT